MYYLNKIWKLLLAIAIIMLINPDINVDEKNNFSFSQDEIVAQPGDIIGDDFELAVEYPEMWDAGCRVLCYLQGLGCEDWSGTGQGYEVPMLCEDVPD